MTKSFNGIIHIRCKCGEEFLTKMEAVQHVGLLNPRWPRSSPSDEHRLTIEEVETYNHKPVK